MKAAVKSGSAKGGYGMPFFGVSKTKIEHSHLLRMVWVVFLPKGKSYTVCVR